MDRLQSMIVFRRVVERGGFAAAARDLAMSNGAVSKHVAALEERLGTRLLLRTTRRVSATEAGRRYFERCASILDAIDEAEEGIGRAAADPAGLLRANVPASFGLLHVAPLLTELSAQHPQLRLEVTFEDRFVDLVEEGVDVVIRVAAALPDSTSLVATSLAGAGHVLCAAPTYLERRGAPASTEDLREHEVVAYGLHGRSTAWSLEGPRGAVKVAIEPRLVLGSSLAVRDAVLRGAGIALLPTFYVAEELANGTLRTVLPAFTGPRVTVWSLTARTRRSPAKIRAFVDLLRRRFASAAWARAA